MRNLISVILGAVIVSASASELPFVETFEVADGISSGTIHGQNGWTLSEGSADVQSGVVQAGSQALQIQNGRVSREVSSDGSAMWLHFQVYCASAPDSNPTVPAGTPLSFFVNTDQNLVVYSNAVPVVLGVQMPLGTWTRFDVYCDYADSHWDLSMDGINIAAGLPLATNKVGSMTFGSAGSSLVYVDQIDLADMEQTSDGLPDWDGDTIPDWWEQKYFGGISSVAPDDTSGNNGYTYLQAYTAGVSPTMFDPFHASIFSDGSGLRWDLIPSRLYSVYWALSLMDDFSLLQGDIPYPQSEFIDLVHSSNADVNWHYEVRQTAGLVVAPYSLQPQYYTITGSKLQQNQFAKWLRLNANLASHIAGHDFELSFKVAQMETDVSWSSIYMNDADDLIGDSRVNSNLGLLVWGKGNSIVYTLYHGVGAQLGYDVAQSVLDTTFGSFDRSEEHTLQFISKENGGSSTYDFVVDGITITNLPYAFSEDTIRQIETVGVMDTGNPLGGVYYDDLGVRLTSPPATVFFDSFDIGPDSGFYYLKVRVQ